LDKKEVDRLGNLDRGRQEKIQIELEKITRIYAKPNVVMGRNEWIWTTMILWVIPWVIPTLSQEMKRVQG
jgi:hypothetical protein